MNGKIEKIKKYFFYVPLALIVMQLFIMFTPFANWLGSKLVVEERLTNAELVVVMSGGAFKNGVLGWASLERMVYGMELYKKGYGKKIAFVGGGISDLTKKITHTVTKSDSISDIDVGESGSMATTAEVLGIPKEDMYVDAESTQTYGNVLYVSKLMKEKGFKNCIIVTSPTHTYRTMRVAEKLSLNCTSAHVADHTELRNSAIGRLSLLREVFWEFAGLALYKTYGYI